jgi:hypothetical protein
MRKTSIVRKTKKNHRVRNMKKLLLTAAICSLTLITSHADPTVGLRYGATSVKLSTTTTDALTALEVKPSALSGSYLYGSYAYFPIFGGALDLENAKGEILHSGGLKFKKGDVSVTLAGFSIDTTGAAPVLTGLAAVNGDVVGRIPIFNVVLPEGFSVPLPESSSLRLSDVKLTLTETAAGALNASFGVTAFAAGLDIGTARVHSSVRKQ